VEGDDGMASVARVCDGPATGLGLRFILILVGAGGVGATTTGRGLGRGGRMGGRIEGRGGSSGRDNTDTSGAGRLITSGAGRFNTAGAGRLILASVIFGDAWGRDFIGVPVLLFLCWSEESAWAGWDEESAGVPSAGLV
jgi:hypothetical protein